jgi:hypothetical protein
MGRNLSIVKIPGDYISAVNIYGCRQIQKALRNRNVGYADCPDLIGLLDAQSSKQIGLYVFDESKHTYIQLGEFGHYS